MSHISSGQGEESVKQTVMKQVLEAGSRAAPFQTLFFRDQNGDQVGEM